MVLSRFIVSSTSIHHGGAEHAEGHGGAARPNRFPAFQKIKIIFFYGGLLRRSGESSVCLRVLRASVVSEAGRSDAAEETRC